LVDLRTAGGAVAEILAAATSPRPLLLVPWPKPTGGERQLSVMDPFDELAMRTAASYLVRPVDDHLPSRPTVSGYRLAKGPPAWRYQHLGKAHERRRAHLRKLVEADGFKALVITDVADCYGSIDIRRCLERIERIGGSPAAIDFALAWMETWQHRDGLRGLPVGAEWSPIYAHAMLSAVDAGLVWAGYLHDRWSDDVAAVVLRRGSPDDLLATIDQSLGAVALVRSVAKTEVVESPEAAFERVVDRALSGLLVDLETGPVAETTEQARETLVQAIAEMQTEPRATARFRFALRTLKNRNDPWAATFFECSAETMQIDPTTVGQYLRAIAPSHPDAVAALFPLLAAEPDERTTAVQVHLLRAAGAFEWGGAEGRLFEAAHSEERPEIVRWWAAEALAHCPAFSEDRCVAAAVVAEHDAAARRFALPLRSAADEGRRRRCAAYVAGCGDRLGPTVNYLQRI
jgi:hypothetical protein